LTIYLTVTIFIDAQTHPPTHEYVMVAARNGLLLLHSHGL